MPVRRPYASRGVPRRATTRPTGSRFSRAGLGVLVLVVAAAVGCVGYAVSSSASASSATQNVAPLGGGVATAVSAVAAYGSAPVAGAATVPGAPTQVAGTSTGPSSVDLRPVGTPLPTTRQWQTEVPGVINDPLLASLLDQTLLGVDGHVGVAVKDLGTGRGAVLNGGLELQSASLYKLPVLYTVFDLGLSMNEELPITSDALSYDSGTMELGPGETLSVAELLERMVTLSDNTSAVMLGTRVGAGNINASIALLGMDSTHYSLERMTTSALDMLHLIDLIATRQAVTPAASADMLHLMLRQRVNDRLPRLVADDVQVAHKTGNLPGVVNDVGILYSPTSTVAVAALVSDTTDETAAATAIARLAQVANAYFDDEPPISDRPLVPPPPTRPIPPVWREPRPVPTLAATLTALAEASDEVSPTATEVPVRPAATVAPTSAPSPTPVIVAVPPTAPPTAKPTPPPPAPTATPVPQPPAPTASPVVVVAPPTKAPGRTVAPTTTPPAKRN